MRPGQQNGKNRSRGRGNGGRKHLNPLSRSYESNGPDVKIRGNAAHIAEKYQQLARDAHASGDSVMAENYLQHAEHYFRILSAAQMGAPRSDQPGFEPDLDEEESEEVSGEPAEANGHAFDSAFDGRRRESRPRPPENQPRLDRPAFVSEIDGTKAGESAGQQAASTGEQQAAPGEAADAEGEAPRRGRRPRRRRTPMSETQAGNAEGPQPEIGELPAFLTAGSSNAS